MATSDQGGVLLGGRSAFAVGVAAALAAGVLGPYIGRMARPWLRSTIRVGINVAERVRVRSSELLEDLEDLAAEARRPESQPRGDGRPDV